LLDPISNSCGRFDRKAGGFPFGIAVLKAMNAIAPLSQGRDRLEGEDAVRTAAVGDHLSVGRKLTQTALQLGERDIERARKMPDRKFAGLLWDRIGHSAVFYFGAAFAVIGGIALLILVPEKAGVHD
jgi:hypothetical protein